VFLRCGAGLEDEGVVVAREPERGQEAVLALGGPGGGCCCRRYR